MFPVESAKPLVLLLEIRLERETCPKIHPFRRNTPHFPSSCR